MAVFVDTQSLCRAANIIAALEPCPLAGKVTADQVKIALGEHLDIWPLSILPVDRETLSPWEGSIYGALMMGWGTTLLCVGRLAFRRNDPDLMKALLYGVTVWLVVEALASVYFRVWFNVGVDIAVLALFSAPLLKGLSKL